MRFKLLFCFLAISTILFIDTVHGAITIESRIGDRTWRKNSAVYPLKGQVLSLRIHRIDGAEIRWYEIMPDIDRAAASMKKRLILWG